MPHTFKLKVGEITFEDDRIRIIDNAKKDNRLALISSVLWVFYGTVTVWNSIKTDDKFILYLGLFIGVAHLVILVMYLFRSYASEISMESIKSVKAKKRFNNKFLDIKLKNNRIRRVNGLENIQELADYIKVNLEDKLIANV
jgi:hypothetical protein